MPRVETLYSEPHRPLLECLLPLIDRCEKLMVAVGFMTASGARYLIEPLVRAPDRLSILVAGYPTGAALEGLDRLLKAGVPRENLWVHMGKVPRSSGSHRAIPRLRPMMHSKIFYLSMGGGRDVAIVGSHNATGYALTGENCELAMLVEGDSSEKALADIRSHILACLAEAIPYEPGKKRGIGQHTVRFLEGLVSLAESELPDEGELGPTIVVLTAVVGRDSPAHKDVVYLELPEHLPITTVGTEVHLYLFSEEPKSNKVALETVEHCGAAWRCRTLSTGIEARTAEGSADWYIRDPSRPLLERTRYPFRPSARPERRQVFIRLDGEMKHRYRYEFDSRPHWELMPEQDSSDTPEWRRVVGLKLRRKRFKTETRLALRETSPASENYVLLADRRHTMEPKHPELPLDFQFETVEMPASSDEETS